MMEFYVLKYLQKILKFGSNAPKYCSPASNFPYKTAKYASSLSSLVKIRGFL